MTEQQGFHLVSLGGGNGAGQVLQGAAGYFARRSGVIAVTDSGRSTGLARAIADIPAPGDIRNTIATLARDPNSLMARLLQQRIKAHALEELEGMALGNLILGVLAQMTGDFAQAVELLSELVGSDVHVMPVSSANTALCAELEDGTLVEGEVYVRGLNKAPIKRLFLREASPAYQPALDAILQADLVTIGPGSHFTTVLATLLFDGVREALRDTRAKVVYICNTTTQPGQTDGYTVLQHVERLVELLGPGVVDIALINQSNPPTELIARYAVDGLHFLQPSPSELQAIEALGIRTVLRDLTEQPDPERKLWNKQDTIRHDPQTLAKLLYELQTEAR